MTDNEFGIEPQPIAFNPTPLQQAMGNSFIIANETGKPFGVKQPTAQEQDSLSRFNQVSQFVDSGNAPSLAGIQKEYNTSYNLQKIANASPTLIKYLGDLNNARLMNNDIEVLSGLEKIIRGIKDTGTAALSGLQRFGSGVYGALEYAAEVPEAIYAGVQYVTAGVERNILGNENQAKRTESSPNPFSWVKGKMAEYNAELSQAADFNAAKLNDYQFIPRTYYNAVSSMVGQLPFTVQAIVKRNPMWMVGGAFAQQFVESEHKARALGLDPISTFNYALFQGGAEALPEMIPAANFIKNLKLGSGFFKTFADAVVREVPTEMATTLMQKITDAAYINPNITFDEFKKDLTAAEQETIGTTIWQTLLTAGIGRMITPRAKERQKQEQTAEQLQNSLTAINELVGSQEVSKKDGRLFQSYIKSIVDDGVSSLYLSPTTLLEIEKKTPGILDALSQTVSPETYQTIKDAIANGTDIVLPFNEYVTKVSGTPLNEYLQQHLSIEPDGLTLPKIQEFRDAEVAKMQQQVDSYLSPEPPARDNVVSTIQNQIAQSKTLPKKQASVVSAFVGNLYDAFAKRLGMTAEELYNQIPLNIESSANDGGKLGEYIQESQTIKLFKNANPTTFLHESGHFFLDLLQKTSSMQNAPVEMQGDMQSILKWFGVKDLNEWNNLSDKAKVVHHEKFARGFEMYLATGNAPNSRLKTMFRTFRNWFAGTYNWLSNKKLERPAEFDFEIPANIKSILDRMLSVASDVQTEIEESALTPMFQSQEESGMNDKDWADYTRSIDEAQESAFERMNTIAEEDAAILIPGNNSFISRSAREIKEKIDGANKIKEEVAQEVNSKNVNQLREFLTNETDGRFSQQALDDIYNTAAFQNWRKSQGEMALTAKSKLQKYLAAADAPGSDPDVIATAFGFASADVMIKDLLIEPSAKREIEVKANERIEATYGKLVSRQMQQIEMKRSVFNVDQIYKLQKELSALMSKANRPTVSRSAAREAVKRHLFGKRIYDIKPAEYSAAAIRAGKKSLDMHLAGKFEMAATQKEAQVFNAIAVDESHKALNNISKILNYFKKVQSVQSIKAMGESATDAINDILSMYNLSIMTDRADKKGAALRAYARHELSNGRMPPIALELLSKSERVVFEAATMERDENGELVIRDDVDRFNLMIDMIAASETKNIKNLTYEELLGLNDAIKAIEFRGKTRDKLVNGQLWSEVENNLSESILSFYGDRNKIAPTPHTMLGRVSKSARMFFFNHMKASTEAYVYDGGKDNGAAWNAIIKPMNEASDTQSALNAETTAKLQEIFQEIFDGVPKREIIGGGEMFETIGRKLNLRGRLAIALNVGNESNLNRLLNSKPDGTKYTFEDIKPVLQSLTKKQLQGVQKIWDLFNSFTPDITRIEKSIHGSAPDLIPSRQITIEAADGAITLEGGYYPVVFDKNQTIRVSDISAEQQAKEQLAAARGQISITRSFTMSRVDDVVGMPLLFDIDGLFTGLNSVIHYVSFYEKSVDLARILNSKKIKSAIIERHGVESFQVLKDWQKNIIAQDRIATDGGEKFVAMLRRNISFSRLVFNVMSGTMQLTGLFTAIPKIGASNLYNSLTHIARNGIFSSLKFAREKSAFMANRANTQFRELNELKNAVYTLDGVKQFIAHYGFMPIRIGQGMVDTLVWHAEYLRQYEATLDERQAVALADQMVKTTQGGGQAVDLSAIEQGNEYKKMLTVLYSFMNTQLNNLSASGRTKTKPKFIFDAIIISMLPVIANTILRAALSNDLGDDDDEYKKLKQQIARDLAGNAIGLFVGVRELNFISDLFMDGRSFGYDGPAGFAGLADLAKFVIQSSKDELDKGFVKAGITLAGDMFGIPSVQINRMIDAYYAQESSEARPIMFGMIFGEKAK